MWNHAPTMQEMLRSMKSGIFWLWSLLVINSWAHPVELQAQGVEAGSPSFPLLLGKETAYEVSAGDVLYGISRRFDLSFMSIALANRIEDPHRIYAGQTLILPTRMILPENLENGILINLPEYRLYFIREDHSIRVYPVCIGLPTWKTPLGEFTATHLLENPTWYMPKEIAEREHVKREVIPPGPLNPLGDFWVGTDLKGTGIHSTNVPMSIGRPLSHGCVRLYPEDAGELFEQVQVGMRGRIIYEPVKITVQQDSVFVEIHPDVYELVQDYREELARKLTLSNVTVDPDSETIRMVLEEKRGIPVFVGILVYPTTFETGRSSASGF